MFKSFKTLSAALLAAGAICIGGGASAQAQSGIQVYQGPSQPVDMTHYINGVWYTEADESKQFHLFDEKGGWEMASYLDFDQEPMVVSGRYEVTQIDNLLYTLTIKADLPTGLLEIPDTVMVGEDMKSIVSVETGGIFMRIEDDMWN